MRYVIILFVLFVLYGCANPERIAAQREYEAQQARAQQEAYRQRVHGQCRSYGFADGTDQFRNCLMQVDQANRAQNAQLRQMLMQQIIQQQGEADVRAMPYCSSLPREIAVFQRARGNCK